MLKNKSSETQHLKMGGPKGGRAGYDGNAMDGAKKGRNPHAKNCPATPTATQLRPSG